MARDRAYAICANCIMDTSDANIRFDRRGWCDYCVNYYENILPNWHPDERGQRELEERAHEIRRWGKGRDHDCLIGISGGVDSSYVTYVAVETMGLRPLLFHVDAGWNSREAVHNIERLVDRLSLDLHTEVVDWLEMRDLQLAFFKAQVPHIDTPQDHAFFAGLYNFAARHRFKYILTGANYSTECVREPLEWHYHASDLRQLEDIHRRFGTVPLKTFPTADILKFKIYYRYVKGVRVVKPLNSVPYVKEDAMQLLVDRFGWERYPHKHYESRFTRFYEGYWLPTKFGYDKRRAHFSSLILTEQMTREEALDRISRPALDEATVAQDFEYVATKLDLTVPELRAILAGPNKSYRDYKHSMRFIELGTRVLRAAGIQRAIIR
jgi:N-acetyl sugar amidotransferase